MSHFVSYRGVAALLAAVGADPLAAQSYTVRNINRAPLFGVVAGAQSGTTVFENIAATISVQSGNGEPISGPVRQGLVTIRCQDAGSPGSCATAGNEARILVGVSGASGRALALAEFRANSGTGTILSGTTVGPLLDFRLGGWTGPGNLNFTLDALMPVLGDDQSSDTAGTAYFYVYANKDPDLPTTGLVGDSTVTVRRALRLSKIQDLRFGTIVKSADGAGQVTIDAIDGSRSFGGTYPPAGVPTPAYGRALLSIAGEPNSNLNISFSPNNSVPLTDGSNMVSVSLAKSVSGNTTLPVSGQLDIGVGGTINVPKNKPTGEYQGSFAVSVSYN